MRVVCFDVETSGLDADFDIVLCAVAKPLYKGETKVFRLEKIGSDDSAVVGPLIRYLNEADILVAHNGVRFDRAFLNTRALANGLPLLDPRGKIIDPVRLARNNLKMSYNSLDKVSQVLNTKHRKTPTEGRTWLRATFDRDKEAMDIIVKHCIADVLVLEEVMEKMRKFVGKVDAWGSA